METACLCHTEIPHTSRLFSDFQYHFDRLARFYGHNPADPTSYATVARGMAYPADRREQLVAALLESLGVKAKHRLKYFAALDRKKRTKEFV